MTWTTIPTSAVDPDSPIDQALMTALRDNPQAIADGDTGAPRIRIGAWQRLNPGSAIRSSNDPTQSTSSTAFQAMYSFVIMQEGTIRVTAEVRVASGPNNIETRFNRLRNGNSTPVDFINASGTFTGRQTDIAVRPGDEIRVQIRATGISTTVEIRNIRLQTNGEDLIPGGGVGQFVEGNTFNA